MSDLWEEQRLDRAVEQERLYRESILAREYERMHPPDRMTPLPMREVELCDECLKRLGEYPF